MKIDPIDKIFFETKGQFDDKEPKKGHELRFLDKLKSENTKTDQTSFNWKPFLLAAACLIIALAVFTTRDSMDNTPALSSISPELSKTEDFFAATIQTELTNLQNQRDADNDKIISDALNQIRQLEIAYESLKTDLNNSGEDQRVIYAMISNYQSRIDILQQVLERIENIKQLKQV